VKLLLDMGNSRLKSALVDDKGLLSQFAYYTYDKHDPIAVLRKCLNQSGELDAVIMVSVLGKRFHESVMALFSDSNILLKWVTSEPFAHDVVNRYKPPEQLGSDRFVALVAARQMYSDRACIVVDCGTAVTVDTLTCRGEFCGGVIMPGLTLWGESLIGRTGQLTEHQLTEAELFATNTAQAIGSGSLFGLASAIEGVCTRMSEALKKKANDTLAPKLLICGGDSQLIAQYSKFEFELMPNLVLMGLAEYT